MAVTEHPLVGLGYSDASEVRSFVRISDDGERGESGIVAEEVPVALVYNQRPHVVVMATPADVEDLAIGFTLTEGIVRDATDVKRIDVVRASHGIELQLQIPPEAAERLEAHGRGLVSRTGCGLCGVETIGDMLRVPVEVGHALSVSHEALWRAASELSNQQSLNNATHTVHAAGWATADGVLHVVREDVGRHNALDKVLGALARGAALNRDARDGFIVITSRASYEMVQKAALRGVELIAAISRPTGLAIRFADAAGVTLVALMRGRSANVYTGIQRLTHREDSPS